MDGLQQNLPANHGATSVANTAFATVFVIALIVLIPSLIWGAHPMVYFALLTSISGSIVGFTLWHRGHIVTATVLHAGGLIVTGVFTFIGTQTLGGATGILLLASVITAGGFLGLKGAVLDVLLGFFVLGLAYFFGDDLRTLLGFSQEPYVAPEYVLQLFVLFSIPAWGAYVVAIDRSNRKAWHAAVENKSRLEDVNVQLLKIQRHQAKVANIGLQALSGLSLSETEQLCREAFMEQVSGAQEFWPDGDLSDEQLQRLSENVPNEFSLFVDGLVQIISTRRILEVLLEERATLAAELQKEQRLDSLSRMAGGVAHDFNNALMVVTGISDVVLSTPQLPEKAKTGVETIQTVSRHISDMTNQLLLFAKGLPIQEVSSDLVMVVTELTPVLQQVTPNHLNLEITVEELECSVLISPEQVERIVLNLVRNSSVAFPNGSSGNIYVKVFTSKKSGVFQACIQVVDDGFGMDEETLERSIEPYFSVQGSTGLGLSTVHGLIQQVNGKMEIESTIGVGTTVSLWLPFLQDKSQDPNVENEIANDNKGLVLLIDDEPLVRHSVKLLLEKLGWRVSACSGLDDALVVVKKNMDDIAIVVCDIRLNGLDGFSAVESLHQEGLQVPVLYITGFASSSEQRLKPNENLLVKPFNLQQLEAALFEMQV